jgi:DnaJ-class molecular chaperone
MGTGPPMETNKPCPKCQGSGKVLKTVYKKDCPFCGGKGTLQEVPPLI